MNPENGDLDTRTRRQKQKMKVKDMMREAYIIHRDIPLFRAAKLMSSKGINSLLFVYKKKLKGIITERDLLKHFNKRGTISRIMSKKVITIDSEEDIGAALELMRKYNKKKLPVTQKDKLVGIINLIDLAQNADEVGEGFFFN
jgi:CBS domain-containing protein